MQTISTKNNCTDTVAGPAPQPPKLRPRQNSEAQITPFDTNKTIFFKFWLAFTQHTISIYISSTKNLKKFSSLALLGIILSIISSIILSVIKY